MGENDSGTDRIASVLQGCPGGRTKPESVGGGMCLGRGVAKVGDGMKESNVRERLLTPAEAGQLLGGIDGNDVRTLIRAGKLRGVHQVVRGKDIRPRVYVPSFEIDRYIRALPPAVEPAKPEPEPEPEKPKRRRERRVPAAFRAEFAESEKYMRDRGAVSSGHE